MIKNDRTIQRGDKIDRIIRRSIRRLPLHTASNGVCLASGCYRKIATNKETCTIHKFWMPSDAQGRFSIKNEQGQVIQEGFTHGQRA